MNTISAGNRYVFQNKENHSDPANGKVVTVVATLNNWSRKTAYRITWDGADKEPRECGIAYADELTTPN